MLLAYFSQYRYNIIASPSKRLGLVPADGTYPGDQLRCRFISVRKLLKLTFLPYIKYMEESDMSEPLLNVKNLSVDVEEKSILHGISLTINKGETHVLMGPNGAGKSTLGCTLTGNPNYHVTDGEIFFGGENITK